MRLAPAYLAAAAALVAPAPAGAIVLEGAPPRVVAWADASRVPTAPVHVRFYSDDPPGLAPCPTQACSWNTEGAPTVMLRPRGRRSDLLHELGHVFDYRVLTNAARRRVLAILGDARSWRDAPNAPHERFAEAYSICAAGQTLARAWASRDGIDYGYGTSERDHRRVCSLVRRVAARAVAPEPA